MREIRACDNLEEVAERIIEEQQKKPEWASTNEGGPTDDESPASQTNIWFEVGDSAPASLEAELSGKLGALRLEEGQIRFIGATSNLMLLPSNQGVEDEPVFGGSSTSDLVRRDPILSWTTVTQDKNLIQHLIVRYTHRIPAFVMDY